MKLARVLGTENQNVVSGYPAKTRNISLLEMDLFFLNF